MPQIGYSMQKRLAADLLHCGYTKVWMNPERWSEISKAKTREEIRKLIADYAIMRKWGPTESKKNSFYELLYRRQKYPSGYVKWSNEKRESYRAAKRQRREERRKAKAEAEAKAKAEAEAAAALKLEKQKAQELQASFFPLVALLPFSFSTFFPSRKHINTSTNTEQLQQQPVSNS